MVEKKMVPVREGVIKYTKPPQNKVPPSQRATAQKSSR
jgi:hypothetical protein